MGISYCRGLARYGPKTPRGSARKIGIHYQSGHLYPHAVGYPIVWPEDKDTVTVEHFSVGNPNAEQVLSNCLATAADHSATFEARAVALCWVLHLTADLHQPLHADHCQRKKATRGRPRWGLLCDRAGG